MKNCLLSQAVLRLILFDLESCFGVFWGFLILNGSRCCLNVCKSLTGSKPTFVGDKLHLRDALHMKFDM